MYLAKAQSFFSRWDTVQGLTILYVDLEPKDPRSGS